MDVYQLLNAVLDANVSISINLNATFPIAIAILSALHLRKKISEKRAKDKQTQSEEDTKECVAHPQLTTTEDKATCPKTEDKSSLITRTR